MALRSPIVSADGKYVSGLINDIAINNNDWSFIVLDRIIGSILYSYPLKNAEFPQMNGNGWSSDSRFIFWTTHFGMYKTDLESKTTIKLKTNCDARYYYSVAVSQVEEKIYFTKITSTKKNRNTVKRSMQIYEMDFNGNNEKLLQL